MFSVRKLVLYSFLLTTVFLFTTNAIADDTVKYNKYGKKIDPEIAEFLIDQYEKLFEKEKTDAKNVNSSSSSDLNQITPRKLEVDKVYERDNNFLLHNRDLYNIKTGEITVKVAETETNQGRPVVVFVESKKQIRKCYGTIGMKTIPFCGIKNNRIFRGIFGIDIFDKSGKNKLTLTLHFRDGTVRRLVKTVNIKWIPKYKPVRKKIVTYKKVRTKRRKRRYRKVRVVSYVKKTKVIPQGGEVDSGYLKKDDPADLKSPYKSIQLWGGAFLQPIKPRKGAYPSPFGARRDFYIRKTRSWVHDYHRATDIANKTGTPVKASNSGIVRIARYRGGAGNAVIIDHGSGISTAYYHMSKIKVKEGLFVRKGQVIGYVGSTGRSTGPHIHWEVRANGTRTSPLKWKRDFFSYDSAITLPE